MIEITTLIDNYDHPSDNSLVSEHGLSFWIAFNGTHILCDMGASGTFWENASRLNIDLRSTDWAFLSHGHNDHTGGLRTFLEQNDQTPVYLSPHVFRQHYFSARRVTKRDISTELVLHDFFLGRFHFIAESTWITPEIALVKNDTFDHPTPFGNRFLTVLEDGQEQSDDFKHELSLAMLTEQGWVVLSSCSHNGALNILDSCKRFTGATSIHAFIGGLHFVDSPKVETEARTFLHDKNLFYPETDFYIGHCTGPQSRVFLQEDPKISFFYTGKKICF